MLLDLDTVIFVGFLAINLAVGLYYSRGVKNVREYAIGKGDFSIGTVATTITATYIGAGFITAALTESYRQGLYFIIPVLGEPLALVVTGYFLVPRMAEFIGKTSVAEAMGGLYGETVKIITALGGIFIGVGIVALQLKVSFSIMKLFFGMSSFYASAISAIIVILYSSLGGIKAVTFTDILQFFTFGVIVPIICLSIWQDSNSSQVIYTISNNKLFDFHEVLSPQNPRFIALICLFLYFVIPSVDPAYFQRISMSKGIAQGQRSFIIAGFTALVMLLVVCWTSILLLSSNPNLEPTNLLAHILENHTHAGLKGLAAVGIMAAIMSTTDSYLNCASVLFSQNVVEKLMFSKQNELKKLFLLRLTNLTLGFVAFIMAYRAESAFQILVMTLSLYMPVISVPLLLAIFGFRSSTKVVLLGMAAGILTVLFWSNFYSYTQIGGFGKEVIEETNEAIPGMLANLIVFILAHLICGRPKGNNTKVQEETLKGTAGKLPNQLSQQRKRDYAVFFNEIRNFSIMKLYKKNFAKQEYFYILAGLFSAISIFSEAYLIGNLQNGDITLFNFVYSSVLFCSFVLMIYPILKQFFKKEENVALFRMVATLYVLVAAPTLITIMSKFEQMQIMLLLLNILVFGCIVRWKLALVAVVLTCWVILNFYTGSHSVVLESIEIGLQFKIIYILLLVSGIIIAFLKPKQEAAELAEEKVDHLSHIVEDQNQEIMNLSTLKRTFLMNLQHETNTPITGVYSMSQALGDCYDKLTDEERKKAIATITTSSERLISYANNLIDVSKLMSSHYNLKVQSVNLSNLLEERIRKCKKLYIPKEAEEDRDIIINIELDLKASCDEYFIKRSFENLIINAIQYCKKGSIVISLTQNKDKGEIEFTVKDSGIGIPQEELNTIFDPFVTSSKTTTPAGGRGMGLTLVKAVAEAHKGMVTARNGENGESIFTLFLPKMAL